jgi:hypothetical protein
MVPMNEQFAFWVNLIASSTAIVGLFFVAYQLSRARKAEVRQFHFDTFKLFSIDMKQDRLLESRLQWENHEELTTQLVSNLEAFHAFKNILDFYTLIAAAARDNTINRDKALEYWGQPVISYWTKYGQLYVKQRHLFGPESAGDLEWFYNEATEAHPFYAENVEKVHHLSREARKGT